MDCDRRHIVERISVVHSLPGVSSTAGAMMILDHIPLIFATVALLAVFAFAAEAGVG
jgi:hypothetical protein